jgi:hypothetical protein
VLRIRDIFVRIRICGSVPLTNGSGFSPDPTPDAAIFVSDLQDGKIICLLLFEATFLHHFPKIKSNKEVTTRCFYTDSDAYLVLMDPDLGGPKSYGSGSESAALLSQNVNYNKNWS